MTDLFKPKKITNKDTELKTIEANCAEVIIPRNLKEAKQSKNYQKWMLVMNKEIENMNKRDAWTPVPKTYNNPGEHAWGVSTPHA